MDLDAEATMPALPGVNHAEDASRGGSRELIQRLEAGDAVAFEQTLAHHERLVLGLALRVLGDRDEARDAAQDVFLRLFRYRSSLDPARPLEPWLCRVTLNVCRDRVRARRAPLAPVFEPLRRTLSFKRYRYLTTLTQRTQEGARPDSTGAIVWPFPAAGARDRPATYRYSFLDIALSAADAKAAVVSGLFAFRIALQPPATTAEAGAAASAKETGKEVLSMSTSLEVREGEQVIVGTSAAGDVDRAIIVVLSVRRI